MIFGIDWVDVGLHVLVAVGAVAVLTVIGIDPRFSVLANAVFWFVREGLQSRAKGKSVDPRGWPTQKHLEWAAPAVAGGATAWAVSAWVDSVFAALMAGLT